LDRISCFIPELVTQNGPLAWPYFNFWYQVLSTFGRCRWDR